MTKFALLSVSDRTGLSELAAALYTAGYSLLATSGTGKELDSAKLPWQSVESYTGLAELLDGRVKTLHPKIHGGILSRRDLESHLSQMKDEEILPIDVVVVNLYPFTKYLRTEKAKDPLAMTELVDVGGPTMIRAAAKNHRFVLPLIDPSDYPEVISYLKQGALPGTDMFPSEFRRRCAASVFKHLSEYDGSIAAYFAGVPDATSSEEKIAGGDEFPQQCAISLTKSATLRYGENPHQKAALYTVSNSSLPMLGGVNWNQLSGKELSYNNMLDLDAALRLLADLPKDRIAVGILKHLNPCGVALGQDVTDAIQRAKQCDPRSHFGGVLVTNNEIDRSAAESIREDFAELVIAPGFTPDGLEILKTSKTLRVIKASISSLLGYEVRSVAGGLLVQQPDVLRVRPTEAQLVTKRAPTADELVDLELAWRVVAHVKSNAIVLVKDGLLVGVGAGQMSRIDSIETAIRKASAHGHLLEGSVAASDAFFPFPDSIEALADVGVTCVVSPGGAKRDDDVQAKATERNMSLFFAATRHFRH